MHVGRARVVMHVGRARVVMHVGRAGAVECRVARGWVLFLIDVARFERFSRGWTILLYQSAVVELAFGRHSEHDVNKDVRDEGISSRSKVGVTYNPHLNQPPRLNQPVIVIHSVVIRRCDERAQVGQEGR